MGAENAPKDGHYQRKRSEAGKALSELMRPVRWTMLAVRVLTLASCAVGLAPYIALTKIGAILLADGDLDRAALAGQVKLLLGAFLTQALLYVLALLVSHLADLKLRAHMQDSIVERISRAPLSWFSDSASGRVRKALQDDTATVHALVAHAPVEQTAAIASPLILLAYVFTINWRLGLLAVVTYPIYVALQAYTMRGMGAKTAEMDDKLGDVSARAIELTEGIYVVKNFGQTGRAHARYTDACRTFARFYWNWCGPLCRASSLSLAVISVATLMAINLGGGLAMAQAGWVSVPEVLVCCLVSLILPRAIEVVGTTMWSYQNAGNAALRLREILSIDTLEYPTEGAASPDDLTVRFEEVTYSYPGSGGAKALDHVSLTLTPGTVTALVGPSGSGKSTLATMLARFRDPDAGRITLGGIDLRDMSAAQLYSSVSFVLQDPYLQRRSIRANIALARPDASDDAVRQAARAAHILDDIEALPAGFDTVLGDDTDLSGGQKQRIAIARAILADAPILILDEATASTDPDCEAEIQAALARLAQGRTVLVIGHHAESVSGADVICVMRGGCIEASGSASDLADQPYWLQLAERSAR